MLLAGHAILVHARERRAIKESSGHKASWMRWYSGLPLWCWAASLTGAEQSPALYLSMAALLHNLRDERMRRLVRVGILVGVPVCAAHYVSNPSLVWQPPMGWTSSEQYHWVYIMVAVALVTMYTLVFGEYRPLREDLFVTGGTFGLGYPDRESLFRAVLARSMSLYGVEAGYVALPLGGDSQSHDATLQIRYCAGQGLDDLPPGEDAALLPDDADHEAFQNETATMARRHWWRGRNRHGVVARSQLSFAIRRFDDRESVAVITLLTSKPFWFLVLSTYQLDVLRAEAQTLIETLAHLEVYARLLRTRADDFANGLANACELLVPPDARGMKVEISVSRTTPDPGDAMVPVYGIVDDGATTDRPRWITVLATMKRTDVAAMQTVRRFLQEVAAAPLLTYMAGVQERLQASDKEPIALANLEPLAPEEICCPAQACGEAMKGKGFRLLWANQVMISRFPRIQLLKTCEADRTPRFCYEYYNDLGEESPCPGCPCVRLLARYYRADPDEREEVARQVEVGSSHSPAGDMRIFRHYELAASLVLSHFPPQEISCIRETVTDRTLEVELSAIMSKTAKVMERFAAGHHGQALDHQHAQHVASEVLAGVVEGLGRSFQARHVLVLDVDEKESVARLQADYVCCFLRTSKENRDAQVSREWKVLRQAVEKGHGLLAYFENREPLFAEAHEAEGQCLLPSATTASLLERRRAAIQTRAATEVFRDSRSALFDWLPLAHDERCLVLPIPHSRMVLLICTDLPSGVKTERSSRVADMQLCQSVGDMLGFLLRANALAAEMAASTIARKVSELSHEMAYHFVSLPQHTAHVRSLIGDGEAMQRALAAATKHGLGTELAQWHHELAATAQQRAKTGQRTPGFAERCVIENAYIREVCGGDLGTLNPSLFDQLARSGVGPESLKRLSQLRNVPADDKGVILTLLADLAAANRGIGHIASTAEAAQRAFNAVLSRPEIHDVCLSVCVNRLVQLIEGRLPGEAVMIEVSPDLVAALDRCGFELVMRNLLSNALEAVQSSGGGQVRVTAELCANDLVVKVANPPPFIPATVAQRMFGLGCSTKPGGSGTGLVSASNVAKRMGASLDYAIEGNQNVFTFTVRNARGEAAQMTKPLPLGPVAN